MIWLAAFSMVIQDILAVCQVQAEARDRALIAAVIDPVKWAAGITVTFAALEGLHSHSMTTKVVTVAAICVANFTGSYLGVVIGKRLIKEEE